MTTLLPLDITGFVPVEQLYDGPKTLVWRARRLSDGEPVIIKRARDEGFTPRDAALLRAEHEILRDLRSPLIVKPLALLGEGSRSALILEDIGARSLREALAHRRFELAEVLQIGATIAEALQVIFHQGILHKDINPQNIIINAAGRVQLIDFGIATRLSRENPSMRNISALEGTLAYMSPEQTGRMNRPLDYRTDFYSLGATLYELLCGAPPFVDRNVSALVHALIARAPEPPRARAPQVPEMVSQVVMRLLAKTPEERYQSAHGIKADLDQCRRDLELGNEGQIFALGAHDRLERFEVPDRLYGREAETRALEEAYARVAAGSAELLMIKGRSGVGKSALINEVHKPMVAHRALYASGKVDQYKRDVPYSAVSQAFDGLLRRILAEDAATVARWRSQTLAVVGRIGQVLVDVIPSLELLIGEQPPVPELEPKQAQSRFELLFEAFLRVFARPGQPLVLFLDDLQWADSGTLSLIKLLLTDPERSSLLLIGAYRDNEVGATHPLALALDDMEAAGVKTTHLALAPLDLASTSALTADALRCAREQAGPLAALLREKTEGNPLFVREFLLHLYHKGLINYDARDGIWRWRTEDIEAAGITANIADLLTAKLRELPAETVESLRVAACIGNVFDLATLSVVSEREDRAIAESLWPALRSGLLVPLGGTYRTADVAVHNNTAYRFVHDRVQQAAYNLIEREDLPPFHHRIGLRLWRSTPEAELDDKVFEILAHLNFPAADGALPLPARQLAELNLRAGKRARASGAYAPAVAYLQRAQGLLPEGAWKTDHGLMRAISTELAESLDLHGDSAAAQGQFALLLQHAESALDRATVQWLQANVLGNHLRSSEAMQAAIEGLRILDVPIPRHAGRATLWWEYLKTRWTEQRVRGDLRHAPECTDPEQLATIGLLMSLYYPCFMLAPDLAALVAIRTARLTMQHGQSKFSAFAYATYGGALAAKLRRIPEAIRYVELAEAIREARPDTHQPAGAWLYGQHYVGHFRMPLPRVAQKVASGLRMGIESGDLVYAGISIMYRPLYEFDIGVPLSEIIAFVDKNYEFAKRGANAVGGITVCRQAARSLRGETIAPGRLGDSSFDEEAYVARGKQQSSRILQLYSSLATGVAYVYRDLDRAVEVGELGQGIIQGYGSFVHVPRWCFFYALALLGRHQGGRGLSRADRRVLAPLRAELRRWARGAPENYLGHYQLVEAEEARIVGGARGNDEALRLYERAIACFTRLGAPNLVAIAYECVGRFYLGRDLRGPAVAYLQMARSAYVTWGASGKVHQLEQEFIALRSAAGSGAPRGITVSPRTTSESIGLVSLDVEALLRAARALSDEIVLDKLVTRTLHILLENAGADRGLLLLLAGDAADEGELPLRAIAERRLRDDSTVFSRASALDGAALCAPVVHYVARTHEPLLIDDARRERRFDAGAYFAQHEVRSVLCLPILHQGELTAILYLENHVTTGAFTAERVQVVEMLASQAAISLENAMLYARLEEKVQERTRALEAAQQQVLRLEKEALELQMAGGFAHEIRNALSAAQNLLAAAFGAGSVPGKSLVADNLARVQRVREALGAGVPADGVAPLVNELDRVRKNEQKLGEIGRALHGAVERTLKITAQTLEYARSGRVRPGEQSVDLGEVVRGVLEEYAPRFSSANVAVRRDLEEGLSLPCDPGHLQSMVTNLIHNACDALATLEDDRPRAIEVRLSRDHQRAVLRVRDNGVGMSDEVKEGVFRPFFTTKPYAGTGLGLGMVRKLVHVYGGEISFESTVDVGTEFVIKLPLR